MDNPYGITPDDINAMFTQNPLAQAQTQIASLQRILVERERELDELHGRLESLNGKNSEEAVEVIAEGKS